MPDDCRLILIGLAPEQIESVTELPNVIGLPRTGNVQELVFYYSIANVVLNLSREETFGLTTVEGMACGTPSIVYNATASPELVNDQSGFVVEPGDIRGVKESIGIIMKKGKHYYEDYCRSRTHDLFEAKGRYQDYVNTYNQLISK